MMGNKVNILINLLLKFIILNKVIQATKDIDIKVNDKFTDKVWGENIVKVVNINNTQTHVKYRFIQIDNIKIDNEMIWTMDIDNFKHLYIKLEKK